MTEKDKRGHSPLSAEDANSIGLGRIEISDQVIAAIASRAAAKIEGVAVTGSAFRFADLLGSKENLRKAGVSVRTDQDSGHVEIDLDINVEYGVTIYEAARQLQVLVKEEVEAMTGAMNVDRVNIRVKQMVLSTEETPELVRPDQVVDQGLSDQGEES